MPDLNSVPPSPHARAPSQQMPPPPVPGSLSLNILPSHQSAVNHPSSPVPLPSPRLPPGVTSGQAQSAGSVSGPGSVPLRHPRPMTAADLHQQLEKEQEAVVNRLSRELSLLRSAHNASVVSNASSTSATASGSESVPVSDNHHLNSSSGFSHPLATSLRHHRTSSNSSNRSLTAHPGSISASSLTGISSPAPARPGNPIGGISLSRQNSAASRRSRTSSPGPHNNNNTLPHQIDTSVTSHFAYRNPGGGAPTPISLVAAPGSAVSTSDFSPGIFPGTPRYEETLHYRAELDSVKRENEALKRRVRELERQLRGRRPSDAGRPAPDHGDGGGGGSGHNGSPTNNTAAAAAATSTSNPDPEASTATDASDQSQQQRQQHQDATATAAAASSGVVDVGIPGDTIRVGESAASSRLQRQDE